MSWGLLPALHGPSFLKSDLPHLPESKTYLFLPFIHLQNQNAPYDHITIIVSQEAVERELSLPVYILKSGHGFCSIITYDKHIYLRKPKRALSVSIKLNFYGNESITSQLI